MSLSLSNAYISPNGDGVKDSVDITIEDAENQGWTLQIRGGGADFSQEGQGSDTVAWDGGGLSEGKYNVVLIPKGKKNERGSNLKLSLTLDVTPPVITYNQTNQPNGRLMFEVNIEDNLAGLVPESTGVDLQGINASTLHERIGAKKASFRYQILPSDPEGGFQTQSLMPFSILQTLEDAETRQARINAADPAGNSAFQLAQVEVPKYKAEQDPGGNHQERCKSKEGNLTGSLKLAKVYDFDKNGPNLTFLFRYDFGDGIPTYNMSTDPIQVLNAQQLGLQNTDVKIAIPGAYNEMPQIQTVYEQSLKYDAGSFRLDNGDRQKVNATPSAYPVLHQLFKDLDPKFKFKSHKELGYHVVAVNMTDLYAKTYQKSDNIFLSLKIGAETAKVRVVFNKGQKRWNVYCAD